MCSRVRFPLATWKTNPSSISSCRARASLLCCILDHKCSLFLPPSLTLSDLFMWSLVGNQSPGNESQPLNRPLSPAKATYCPGSLGTLQPVAGSLLIKWVNKLSARMPPRPVSSLAQFLTRGFWPRNLVSCLSSPCSWIEKSGEQLRSLIQRKTESQCKWSRPTFLSSPHPHPKVLVLFCNISSKITLAFKVSRALEKKKISWDPERALAQLRGVYICHSVATNKLWPHLLFSAHWRDPEA